MGKRVSVSFPFQSLLTNKERMASGFRLQASGEREKRKKENGDSSLRFSLSSPPVLLLCLDMHACMQAINLRGVWIYSVGRAPSDS